MEHNKYCEDYIGETIDETTCKNIKPYIKDTNDLDYSHKCVKEGSKCVTKQRECEDYSSSSGLSTEYCNEIEFAGNPNKRCVLDGSSCKEDYLTCSGYDGNEESECENIVPSNSYQKCVWEASKCVSKEKVWSDYDDYDSSLYCEDLKPSNANNKCIRVGSSCIELPTKCESFTEKNKEKCEAIVVYTDQKKIDYSCYCSYVSNTCTTKQKECSDFSQYECNQVILSDTKKCFYYDSKCQEINYYKNCEDYKGQNKFIC